jgi:hypothetical protein
MVIKFLIKRFNVVVRVPAGFDSGKGVGLLAAIILAGCSSFTYVVMGASSYQFRNFFTAFGTLFRMMLAMVTFRDAELATNAQSNIIK